MSPGPLPPLRQIRTPDVQLPVLEVSNEGSHAAILRLEDGTILFVPAGGTAEAVVGPGTTALEARFDAEGQPPLGGRAIFSYQSRYRLTLR